MRFNPATAKPREIEAYLRKKVLEYFGNSIEDLAVITSSHGYYSVNIPRPDDFTIALGNFRRDRVKEMVSNLKFLANK